MIKYIFSILLSLLAIDLGFGQIPNGSFESWEEIYNYEKPTGWSTNQDTFHTRFEKDKFSVDGQFSLKIIPSETSSWNGCESQAGIHVDFDTPLPSNSALTFYVKTIPFDPDQDTSVYLRIFVYVFNSDALLDAYDWSAFTSIEQFTKAEIPLSAENIDAISILIFGGAGSNLLDGPCLSSSISWIDGMVIEEGMPEGISQLPEATKISVYPNPTNGLIHIRNVNGNSIGFELYSLIGELISKGQIENEELTIHESGTYMLRLFIDDNASNIYTSRLIVVK